MLQMICASLANKLGEVELSVELRVMGYAVLVQ